MKTCTKCNTDKKESHFYKRSNGELIQPCKECLKKRQAIYFKKHESEIAVKEHRYNEHKKLRAQCKKLEESINHIGEDNEDDDMDIL